MTGADENDSAVRRRRARPTRADVVADGIVIATAAARLTLKNRILVEVIVRDADFDADRLVPEAVDVLRDLADQADAEAARAKRERAVARGRFGDPDGTHDYSRRDVRNLRRRERHSTQVAAALRERADDPEQVLPLVLAAREAAWDELAHNIDRTLRIESARPDLEPDYAQHREERIEGLLDDLAELAARRRPAAADSPPADA